ncbi:MAG: DUF2970 domain-containing protein [Betaproteobacteria bacterium]
MQNDPPDPHISPDPPDQATTRPRSSFGQTLSAVLWGFLGVRKRHHFGRDATSLNPVHLIVMAVVMAAVLVVSLVMLVRFITR